MAATPPLVPCFYTTVKNISGFDRAFSFLGLHGKFLKAGTEYTEFGDLIRKFSVGGIQNKRRKQLGLERSLVSYTRPDGRVIPPQLHIKSSPSVVLYDTTANVPKMLSLTGGALGTVDPCYGGGY
jgi:hypothetical protein